MFEKLRRFVWWSLDGCSNYTNKGYIKASKNFEKIDDLPTSKLSVMITGANSGIGFGTALNLIQRKNVTVHIVCRNQERGDIALAKLSEVSHESSNALLHILDIGDIKQVKLFTEKLQEQNVEINVLVNNAGSLPVKFQLQKDYDFEESYSVNVLGTKVLTEGLLSILKSTETLKHPRVITVTSGGAYLEKLEPHYFSVHAKSPTNLDLNKLYSQAKRQQIVLTEYWAQKYPQVMFTVMHPGWVDTPGVEKSLPGFYRMMKSRLRTLEQGCDTIIYLSLSSKIDNGESHSGNMFFDRAIVNKYLTKCTEHTAEDFTIFLQEIEHIEDQYLK